MKLYVYINPIHPDLVGAIGVLRPKRPGWTNTEFVIDGGEFIMVNADNGEDVRPLTWKDRVNGNFPA